MAKFNARLWTAEQLLDMDPAQFAQLTRQELAGVVRSLADVANKRLGRLRRRGELTPASMDKETGRTIPKFSTAGKSLGQLKAEYSRVKSFLSSQTSTVRGAQQWKKNAISSLGKQGIHISNKQFDSFWKAFEKLKEMDPSVAERGLKYQLLKKLARELSERGLDDESSSDEIDELTEDMSTRITDIYEAWQEAQNELSGPEQFFRSRRKQGGGFGPNT